MTEATPKPLKAKIAPTTPTKINPDKQSVSKLNLSPPHPYKNIDGTSQKTPFAKLPKNHQSKTSIDRAAIKSHQVSCSSYGDILSEM